MIEEWELDRQSFMEDVDELMKAIITKVDLESVIKEVPFLDQLGYKPEDVLIHVRISICNIVKSRPVDSYLFLEWLRFQIAGVLNRSRKKK